MRIRDWSSDVCSSDLPPSPAKSRAGSKCFISTIAILEVDGQRHAPLSWASEVSRVIVGERDIAAVERVVLIEQIVHIDGNAHIPLGDRIADRTEKRHSGNEGGHQGRSRGNLYN